MNDKRWADVDAYIGSRIVEEDRALRMTQDAAKMAGLPAIAVSPAQGKFLYLEPRAISLQHSLHP